MAGYLFSHWSGDISTAAPDSSVSICVEGRTPTRQIQVNYTPSKTTPTITFNPAPTPTFGGGNFTVSAGTTNTDSSALTYSVVSGPCALVSSSTFSSSGAGACVVQASGAETANFNAASNTQSVTIAKATSTTTTVGAGPFVYTGSAQTGGSGTVTGAGTITGSATLTYTGDQINAGTYYVTAHYAGDANHFGSDGAAVAIVINKASSTTTTVGDGPFTYDGTTHTGGSGTVTGAGVITGSATRDLHGRPSQRGHLLRDGALRRRRQPRGQRRRSRGHRDHQGDVHDDDGGRRAVRLRRHDARGRLGHGDRSRGPQHQRHVADLHGRPGQRGHLLRDGALRRRRQPRRPATASRRHRDRPRRRPRRRRWAPGRSCTTARRTRAARAR